MARPRPRPIPGGWPALLGKDSPRPQRGEGVARVHRLAENTGSPKRVAQASVGAAVSPAPWEPMCLHV